MHMSTIHECDQETANGIESNRPIPSPECTSSPTPSLEPCKHCGEECCPEASIADALMARQYKPSLVTISHSPLTPAKPLRKKRRLDSLASMAREQAISGSCHMDPFSNGSVETTLSKRFACSADEGQTQVSKHEQMMKLKLEIPGNNHTAHRPTPPSGVSTELTNCVASPTTTEVDTRSPERRKWDELHEGVKAICKRPTASTSTSRLSSFLTRF